MKVLVTGATGFIGRHVTARLLQRGHQLVALSRSGREPRATSPQLEAPERPAPSAAGLADQITPVQANVVAGEGLQEALIGVDAAVHLVGIIRASGGATFEQVHVDGTRNVVAAAQAADVERFVHLSALEGQVGSPSKYLDTKGQAEELVRNSALSWTILRPSLTFGPGDDFFGSVLRDLVRLPPVIPQVGDSSFLFRPVWVGDVACACAAAIERPATASRSFDLVGPAEYSFRELLQLVREALGVRKPIVGVPLPLMRLGVPLLGLLPKPPITRDQFLMLLQGNTGDPGPAAAAFELQLEPLTAHLPEILRAAERE